MFKSLFSSFLLVVLLVEYDEIIPLFIFVLFSFISFIFLFFSPFKGLQLLALLNEFKSNLAILSSLDYASCNARRSSAFSIRSKFHIACPGV